MAKRNKINTSFLRNELLKIAREDKNLAEVAFNEINKDFQIVKQDIIENFENHPITRELKEGPEAPNYSKTIQGEGNLFSFIGFEKGLDPTDPIRTLLNQNITLFPAEKPTYSGKLKIRYNFNYTVPSSDDIIKATPMPEWTSGSWAKRVENSITGIRQYLFGDFEKYSRSGKGIQIKNGEVNKKFTKISYISDLLKEFTKLVIKLGK